MSAVGFDGVIFGLQRVGGISTYAREILLRLSTTDHEVIVGLPRSILAEPSDNLVPQAARVEHDRLPVRAARYLPTALSGDLVHSTYYRVPARRRTRSVVTVYDFVYERYRSGAAQRVHGWQKRAACRRADAILCISENTRKDLCAAYPDIDPNRVTVTPLAVDHGNFFIPERPRADLSETVVFVGQRGGYKRFDLAVEAVAQTGMRFAIVGAPVDASERELLDKWLQGRWVELGRVTNAELRDVYAGCFAFIYPSDYEGFGLPILEAQACGAPAVVANLSSFPEVGGNAALFAAAQTPKAYAEKLEQLKSSPYRSAVIATGIANAARFHWDRTFALTLDAYQRVLGA